MKPAFAGLFLKMILKFSKKLEISMHNIYKELNCIFIILSYNLTLVSYLCIKKKLQVLVDSFKSYTHFNIYS